MTGPQLVPLTHTRIRDLETRLESARTLFAVVEEANERALRLHPDRWHLPCRTSLCPTRMVLTGDDDEEAS